MTESDKPSGSYNTEIITTVKSFIVMFSQRNLEQNLLFVFGKLDYLLDEEKHANNSETVQLTEQ